MVAPPYLETPFRRKARKLVTPAARRFDAAVWEQAFAACQPTTDADRALLEAALWTGREVTSLACALPDPFPGLTAAQAITLGVAALNLEFMNSQRQVRDRQRELDPDRIVSFDYLSHLPYENQDGQQLSQNEFGESGVEALASWLHDAKAIHQPEGVAPSAEEVHAIVGTALRHYSTRKVLKNQFDKALYLGARLVPGEVDVWEPHDRSLARLLHAWHARSETDIVTAALDLRQEWPALSPAQRRARVPSLSVTDARAGPNGSRLVVGRRECLSERPPYPVIDRRAMENSYFGSFLDEEMPLAPRLTVARVAAAWWVIGDAARRLVSLAKREPALQTAGGWAAAVRREELVRTLANALRTEVDTAEAVVDFLTFGEASTVEEASRGMAATGGKRSRKGDRGLWAAPLVPVPGEKVLLLPIAVFELGSFVYRVEAWLERGGIDDEALEHRGDRYEVHLRQQLEDAIQGNADFRNARIASEGVERSDDFPHQVDLLIRLGDRLLVGEIKCFLTPADPHQWDRFYREKLPDAAKQASQRAAELRRRPDVVSEALSIGIEEAGRLSVEPIVVLNIGAGFSLRIGGCRVVHADFLLSYLRSPKMESGAAVRAGRPEMTRLVTLYEGELDAGRRFDLVMADPWPLRRFLDRLSWQETPYPRPTGGTFKIGSPARGTLTRSESEGLQSALLQAGPIR